MLHFDRGSAVLTWRAIDPRANPQLACSGVGASAVNVLGREVFYRRVKGAVTAWRCTRTDLKVIVSELASVEQGATVAALARMIATAHSLPPGRDYGSHYQLLPGPYVKRIRSSFADPFFLPARLPAGFIFSQWSVVRHDVDTDGRRSLFVIFGRDGPVLEWDVYAGRDTLGLDCPGKHPRFAPSPSLVINRHRVFYSVGVGHGWSAWRCVPAHAVGNSQPLELELWYAAQLDSRAMRLAAENILASATLIRAS
jgi:hypothetical protein